MVQDSCHRLILRGSGKWEALLPVLPFGIKVRVKNASMWKGSGPFPVVNLMLPGPHPWDPSYWSCAVGVGGGVVSTNQGPTQLPSIMQLRAHLLGALLLKPQQTTEAASLEHEVPNGMPCW